VVALVVVALATAAEATALAAWLQWRQAQG